MGLIPGCTLPSQLYPVDDDRDKNLNLGVKLSSVLAVSEFAQIVMCRILKWKLFECTQFTLEALLWTLMKGAWSSEEASGRWQVLWSVGCVAVKPGALPRKGMIVKVQDTGI